MLIHPQERRRYPRSRRSMPVKMDLGGPGLLNHVDNISANGVLCHTVKPVPLMTRLRISLELPNAETHRIDGEGIVVRCDPHERGDDHFKVAIIFTKIEEADQSAIRQFVEAGAGAHDTAEN